MGRRMFSDKVVETDKFLDMPVSCQNLYWHLCMHADDDGFLGNPKTITRSIGANSDDLKVLIQKGYLFGFQDGAIAIADWFVHNYIPKDRYHETVYKEDKNQLELSETKQYQLVTSFSTVQDTDCIQAGYNLNTSCIHDDDKAYTEDKLSKAKLNINNNKSSGKPKTDRKFESKKDKVPYQEIVDYLNKLVGTHYLATTSKTRKLIKARFNEGFTAQDFKIVIDKKTAEWLHSDKMVQYLRPDTLFGTKFESYLNQTKVVSNSNNSIAFKNIKPNKRVITGIDWSKRKNQKSNSSIDMSDEELNSIFAEFSRGK